MTSYKEKHEIIINNLTIMDRHKITLINHVTCRLETGHSYCIFSPEKNIVSIFFKSLALQLPKCFQIYGDVKYNSDIMSQAMARKLICHIDKDFMMYNFMSIKEIKTHYENFYFENSESYVNTSNAISQKSYDRENMELNTEIYSQLNSSRLNYTNYEQFKKLRKNSVSDSFTIKIKKEDSASITIVEKYMELLDLNKIIKKKYGRLSPFEKLRVDIFISLLLRNRFILIDVPFIYDAHNEWNEMRKIIEKLCKTFEIAILYSSNTFDNYEIKFKNKIYSINEISTFIMKDNEIDLIENPAYSELMSVSKNLLNHLNILVFKQGHIVFSGSYYEAYKYFYNHCNHLKENENAIEKELIVDFSNYSTVITSINKHKYYIDQWERNENKNLMPTIFNSINWDHTTGKLYILPLINIQLRILSRKNWFERILVVLKRTIQFLSCGIILIFWEYFFNKKKDRLLLIFYYQEFKIYYTKLITMYSTTKKASTIMLSIEEKIKPSVNFIIYLIILYFIFFGKQLIIYRYKLVLKREIHCEIYSLKTVFSAIFLEKLLSSFTFLFCYFLFILLIIPTPIIFFQFLSCFSVTCIFFTCFKLLYTSIILYWENQMLQYLFHLYIAIELIIINFGLLEKYNYTLPISSILFPILRDTLMYVFVDNLRLKIAILWGLCILMIACSGIILKMKYTNYALIQYF